VPDTRSPDRRAREAFIAENPSAVTASQMRSGAGDLMGLLGVTPESTSAGDLGLWAAGMVPVGKVGRALGVAAKGGRRAVRNPFTSGADDAWLLVDDAGEQLAAFRTSREAQAAARRLDEGAEMAASRPHFEQSKFKTSRGGAQVEGYEFTAGSDMRFRVIETGDGWWVYDPKKVEFGVSPNGNPVVRRSGVPNSQRQTRLTEVMQAPEEYGFMRFDRFRDAKKAIEVDFADLIATGGRAAGGRASGRGPFSGGVGRGEGTLSPQELMRVGDPNIPFDRLAREDAGYIAKLSDDIARNGIREPVVVTSAGPRSSVRAHIPTRGPGGEPLRILDGHHRVLAAMRAGIDDIPVIFQPRGR
jgi:hypothetical protein